MSSLPLHRKIGFCYLFHLRWLLLLAAVLAAVVNPLLMSPFIYPLETWSLSVQICVSTAVVLYVFVAGIAISKAITYNLKRPLSLVALVVFFVLGWIYVVLHFLTHTIAFLRVFTGTEGAWEVTARSIKGTSPYPITPSTAHAAGTKKIGVGVVAPALTEPLLAAEAPAK